MINRDQKRYDISIMGRLRTSNGARDVTIVDLSEEGCRIHDQMGYLTPGAAVTIKIGPIGPVDATVRWQHQPHTGIHFDNPLYPAVLEHIRTHFDLRTLGDSSNVSAPPL